MSDKKSEMKDEELKDVAGGKYYVTVFGQLKRYDYETVFKCTTDSYTTGGTIWVDEYKLVYEKNGAVKYPLHFKYKSQHTTDIAAFVGLPGIDNYTGFNGNDGYVYDAMVI